MIASTDTLTVTGAADALGISRVAVQKAIQRGALAATKVDAPTPQGFYWTIERDEIERYRREHQQAPAKGER